jgi:hypothetical protein
MPPSADIREAVRETVRLGRSQTQSALLSHSVSRPLIPFRDAAAPQKPQSGPRRSQSQDSNPHPTDKKQKKPKKGSQHADVIDRLDFTGVGPSASYLPFLLSMPCLTSPSVPS